MSTPSSEIGSRRLDLAGTRDFAVAGAGPARRAALSAFNREWLAEVWQAATGGAQIEGIALAAVGSIGRGDAGPLSDYDLVLLHSERSLPAKELTALADRIWYPIWDAGVRLDHSVRTVTQCRQVAAADLTAAVGLLDLAPIAGDEQLVAAARSTVAHDWRGNARKRLPAARRGRRLAPPAPGRPRAVHRARAQGGPRRPARHDRPVGDGRGVARRPPARRGGCRARPPPRRPRRRARRHRPGARPPGPRGPRRRRGPARPRRRRRPAHRRLVRRAAHRLRPRRHAAPRRPVPARPHPAGRPAPPADDPARPRPVRQRRRGRARLDPARRDRRGDADARRRRRGPRRAADRPDHARQPRQARADPVRPRGPARCATCSATCSRPGPGLVTVWEGLDQVGIVDTWLPGVGGRAVAPAAQRRAPPHRRPPPRRDRGARRRPRAPGLAARPAARRRPAARHRQGARRPRPLGDRRRADPRRSSPAGASRRATSRCW